MTLIMFGFVMIFFGAYAPGMYKLYLCVVVALLAVRDSALPAGTSVCPPQPRHESSTPGYTTDRLTPFLLASDGRLAGVLIFSLYIVHDTQLMLGGSHKVSIGMDDYVFAALNLYLDIINLFLLLLDLLNGGRD